MHVYHEEDTATQALEILTATNTWLLARHQWLIDTMRCILTGENLPPTDKLATFDYVMPEHVNLSTHLMQHFTEIRTALETQWLEATNTIHPMSGLTVYEQLNSYQSSAHHFMLAAKKAHQKLLEEFAMRDSLTGAKTRLTMDATLKEALEQAEVSGRPCAIALIDQNAFKAINDRWGHVVGDEVLVQTANIFQNNLRMTDQLFRLGGDEWLVLMPKTTKVQADKVMQRTLTIYNAYQFKAHDDTDFSTTFSYGIAESSEELTVKIWLTEADKQLYKNKRESETVTQHQPANQQQVSAS